MRPGWIKALVLLAAFTGSCARETTTPPPTPSPMSDPSLMDTSWLSDEPCPVPCWYGQAPGVSTKDEVLDLADSLSFFADLEFQEHGQTYAPPGSDEVVPSELVLLECVEPPGAVCATVEFVEDVLVQITIYPNYRILFDEAVSQVGAPDFVALTAVTPEITDCLVSMIWKSRQLRVSYYEKARDTGRRLCDLVKDGDGRLPSDLPVQDVLYTLPGYLEEYMDGVLIWTWTGFADSQ